MKQVTNAVTTQTVNNYTARNKNKLKLNQNLLEYDKHTECRRQDFE